MTANKYRVELSESQKSRLSEVAHRGKSPARTVKRALALLKADEGQFDNRIADALSISRRTVVRIRKRFCEEGDLRARWSSVRVRGRGASWMSVPKRTLWP